MFDRLSGVFDNAGIAKRHIVSPKDWYEEPHGWHDRNRVYLQACEALFEEAASAAIEQARLEAARPLRHGREVHLVPRPSDETILTIDRPRSMCSAWADRPAPSSQPASRSTSPAAPPGSSSN